MASIKEQAKEFADICIVGCNAKTENLVREIIEYIYITCADNQRKMYIEKACEQFDEAITQLGLDYLISDKVMTDYCSKFRKAMEEE